MSIHSVYLRLGLFTSREWVLVVLCIAICTSATFHVGLKVARQNASEDFESESEMILSEVGRSVVELEGVLKSLLGVHYASDEFAGLDINAFANQLRIYSPFVNSIGVYGIVDEALRNEFEGSAATYKDLPFKVHTYNSNGDYEHHAADRQYLPIISAEPFDGPAQQMLGLDLGSDSDLATVVDNSVSTGEAAIVKAPEGWNVNGDSLLLQPVYFSETVPATADERIELYAGGIWVAIDSTSLLQTTSVNEKSMLQLLTADSTGVSKTLFSRGAVVDINMTDWDFGSVSAERVWMLGQSELTAIFSQDIVASASQMRSVYQGTLLSFFLSLSIIGIIYQRRVVREERQNSLNAITLERENAERTLNSISDAVLAVDSNLSITFVNPAAENWFNLQSADCLGVSLVSLLEMDIIDAAGYKALNWNTQCQLVRTEGKRIADVVLRGSTGLSPTFQLTLASMRRSAVDSSGFILVLQDVSNERELRAELEHQAHHDPLTGVFNRFYFDNHLENLAKGTVNSDKQHALCYLDLDQFKIVNDTCGHPAGDRLLCELTQALQGRIRSTDTLARLGGDEFGIILRDITPSNAAAVAKNIFSWFETAVFEHEDKVFPVRCSMGLVCFSSKNSELSQIMSSADIACYSAKASGRNTLVVYSESDKAMAKHKEDMNWLPRLERALANDEFRLVVQPIATLFHSSKRYEVEHFEFLLRLVDDAGNEIAPVRFIQAAERFDLMQSIDRWVIDNSCRMISTAADQLPSNCSFSINLSGQSAANPELLPYIAERISHYQLQPQQLWFEITETAAISNFDNAVKLFSGLKQLGAKVVLDDFGSGLSSFSYLRNLPVDVLKIDGQFVRDVAQSVPAREMVRAMHHVASAMGLQTVAEFVEDEDVLDILVDMKIDFAQGYLLGRPTSFQSILKPESGVREAA